VCFTSELVTGAAIEAYGRDDAQRMISVISVAVVVVNI
jgi:hypothetical protein